ncbi:acyltransferase [Mycetocola tolaasinivorans]|uniref:Acyltransferase n=1 Tax=Mycetocola tolaasinivorans TaxID=76635 RepID=A0A3L7AC62_9MICO|nr:acyltransferase [Mycetocola tolaasinivorans]
MRRNDHEDGWVLTTEKKVGSGFRLDIQGLRAVAVLAVVADHLFGWPKGGFVGVDVFFVISGYLITSLLLRELQREQTISMSGFVRKRIRRILPASAVTLLVTVTASYFVLGKARFDSILQDGIFASLLSANWRFAAVGTDYFAQGIPVSPLQHFWSLAVEEQFYLVWPLLLIAVCALAAARRRRRGRETNWTLWVFVTMCVVIAVSLAWALVETSSTPTFAYFSTLSRAWELAVGAALAGLLAWRPFRLGVVVSSILVWIGTIGLAASFVIVPASPGFPAPWALLPVLSSMILILGGAGASRLATLHLTNPPMRYIGNISYSLYLWHFPVLILGVALLDAYLGVDHPLTMPLILVGGFVFAILSYHLVEEPVRQSKWLLPNPTRARGTSLRLMVAATAACAALVATSVVAGGRTDSSDVVTAAQEITAESLTEVSVDEAKAALAAEIKASLTATAWPDDLTPTVADGNGVENPPGNTGLCGSPNPPSAAECTLGDPNAPKKAFLVGDSIAQAYAPALAAIFGSGDWSLRTLSMYSCPYIDMPVGSSARVTETCAKRRAQQDEAIKAEQPDLVIISNTYLREYNPATGLAVTRDQWNGAFASTLKLIAENSKKVVVIPQPPHDKEINECFSPLTGPDACVSNITKLEWIQMAQAQSAATTELDGYFIDNQSWFCSDAGLCPPFVGNILVKRDLTHPTQKYVEKLAPVIRHEFVKAGVLSDADPAPVE